jgi:hypothetical protein
VTAGMQNPGTTRRSGVDDEIVLGCADCGLVFMIALMIDAPCPNPTVCPFCGSTDLSDEILLAEEAPQPTPGRPALKLISGGVERSNVEDTNGSEEETDDDRRNQDEGAPQGAR